MDQNTQVFINGLVGGLVGGITSYVATKLFNQYTQTNATNQDDEEDIYEITDIDELNKHLCNKSYSYETEMKIIKNFTDKHIYQINHNNCFAICIDGHNFKKIFKEFNDEYCENNQIKFSPEFTLAMERTAYDLMNKLHASSAYVYSDKIILIFSVGNYSDSSHMYNGNKNKLMTNVSAYTLQQFMYHFNGLCSTSLPVTTYKSLHKLFMSEWNIVFNINIIVFPTEYYLAEFVINNINKCFSNTHKYNISVKSNIISDSYYDTIRFGTFLKREIYEKENLSKTKINERRQIIRFNIDFNDVVNAECECHCDFTNFIGDKYIKSKTYEKEYKIKIINKKVMKDMNLGNYHNENMVMIKTYPIDPNEVNYEVTLRSNDYITWLKYREKVIDDYDVTVANDINMIEYITSKFAEWIAKNNIQIM